MDSSPVFMFLFFFVMQTLDYSGLILSFSFFFILIGKGGLGSTRFVAFETLAWHNECFFCATCKVSMVGKGFIQDGNEIVCPECARKKMIAEMEAENWRILNYLGSTYWFLSVFQELYNIKISKSFVRDNEVSSWYRNACRYFSQKWELRFLNDWVSV